MVVCRRGRERRPGVWGHEYSRHLVHRREVVLVPRKDKQRLLAGERSAAEELWHLRLQPAVPSSDRTVMRVVAQIRRDEGEIRRRSGSEVGRQLGVGDDVAATARNVGLDIGEVDKRIVAGGITGVPTQPRASRRRHHHRLLVCLPALTDSVNGVAYVGRVYRNRDATTGSGRVTVASDAQGRPRGHGQIVGQARMGDGGVIRGQSVLFGQAVGVRRSSAADDL